MSRVDLDILDKIESITRMWPIDNTAATGGEEINGEETEEQAEGGTAPLNIPGPAHAPSSRGPMSRGTVYLKIPLHMCSCYPGQL